MATPPKHSERELVEGCIRNERYYQEQFYRRFFPAMFRMCMRYAQQEDVAIEIVNNGFLKVFQKIDQYGYSGSLEGWVRRIVFHALSDYYRRKKEPLHFLELDQRDRPVQENALDQLYLEDLLQMIEQLPRMSRQVFQLYAIEGYNHREIGEQLGISDGTSKWHLATSRKQLKKMISDAQNNSQYYAG